MFSEASSALLAPAAAVAQADPPAGGAALGQVIGATLAALVVTGALVWLGAAHRSGRTTLLAGAARRASSHTGLPGWAALPSAIAAGSLLVALLGFLWDVAIHIDQGRDEGPLANPSHYLILAGLFGVFGAGFIACVLPTERPSASAVRIAGDWYAPLGGLALLACGTFALTGFPLDDVWHRLFGQDVTLWGPTHLMLIGGAAMALPSIAILQVEARRALAARGRADSAFARRARRVALSGGLLIGLCVFQAEFDFGVPQFRLAFGPVLVMAAAGVGLVAARTWLGRGAALAAVAFFVVVRGIVSLLVGPVLGETTPHFPLFVVSALAVELVFALRPRDDALRLGVWSGLALGTAGLAAEWAWTHVWMPIPWSAELFPEGAAFGLAAALAGSLVGAWMGERLASDAIAPTRGARWGALAGAIGLLAITGYLLDKPAVEGARATVTLERAGVGERSVSPTVRLDPPGTAEGAEMLNVTSWQGGGFVLEELHATGAPGEYRTERPVPAQGTWKTLIRLSRGNTLSAVPVYLPEDAAIPAAEVPATPRFTREFVADHELLQREQRDAPGWLTGAAYLTVAAFAFGLLAFLAWALHRLAAVRPRDRDPSPGASRLPSPASAPPREPVPR